jgi:hypothetical protein
MRVDRGRLNWGIFFIVLGAVPFAYHQGAVSTSALSDAWRLWPLVLVGIGLGFVLSRTPAYFIGGLVVAICVGLVFGSALAVGPNIGCGSGNGNAANNISRSGTFSGSASVALNLQCGSATVTTSSDQAWHVMANDPDGGGATVSAGSNSLTVSSNNNHGWSFTRGTGTWQVQLPANTPIDLTSTIDMGDAHFTLGPASLASANFKLNLGSIHVDLTGAQVGSLSVETNLGAAFVTLDASSDVSGDLKTNLGSLDVCVPSGLGVRITSSDSLSSSDFSGAGMSRVDGAWQTGNYATATHKANISVETSLGSLKLHSAGGCK